MLNVYKMLSRVDSKYDYLFRPVNKTTYSYITIKSI